jgi:hypothetical protein
VNRFEELGLERSATATEIRQAYRNIVRLIHPDRCQDEDLRHLADLQMQRLNETAEILLDPVRRQRYEAQIDQQLPAGSSPVAVLEKAYSAGQRDANIRLAAWCLLAGMVAASLFWFVRDSDYAVRGLALAPEAGLLQPAPGENGDAAMQGRLDDLEGRLRALELSPAGTVKKPVEPPAVGSGMAGDWYYRAPISLSGGPGGLAPEKRVDLKIREQGAVLRGTFNSGYEIHDGILSPTMAFRFEGHPADGLVGWNGAQGTAGAIQFRLLAPNALLATWWVYGTGGNSADQADHTDSGLFHRAGALASN